MLNAHSFILMVLAITPPPAAPAQPRRPAEGHAVAQAAPARGWRATPPPAPPVERVRPRPGFVWIEGNYEWRGGRWVWLRGHWEAERPGRRWHGGRWERQGDRYVWIGGSWVEGPAYVAPPALVATNPAPLPPPPQAAPAPPRPRPGYIWIAGSYEWRDGRYVWVEGRWEQERRGERWNGGHWDREGDRHVWHPGGWERAEQERQQEREQRHQDRQLHRAERQGYAPGGAISIAGQITAPDGRPLPGITVVLAGSSEGRTVTDGAGRYSFSGLAPGSYAVRPTDARCRFGPDVVNLNNLGAPAVQSFSASCDRR